MDIIDNYNRLTLGMYQEIQEISRNESLEDIDKQVQILSVLTGVAEDEILHLPIHEYKELVVKAGFLNPENRTHSTDCVTDSEILFRSCFFLWFLPKWTALLPSARA